MAKKRAIKGITKINQKQAALEGYSYERAYHTAKQAGEPSYRFAAGDWYEEFVGTPEEKDIRCGDCGAKIGYYHHYGCDIEKCPICGGQFLSCDCLENFDSAVLTI